MIIPDSSGQKPGGNKFGILWLLFFLFISILIFFSMKAIRVNGIKPITGENKGKLPFYSVADVDYEVFLNYDGSIVAFCCPEKKPDNFNGKSYFNVFVLNRKNQRLTKISKSFDGKNTDGDSFSCVVSGNGRFVAYESDASNIVKDDTNGASDIFLFDRLTGKTRRISTDANGKQADGSSGCPSISFDGSLVSFSSKADNLVEGDTNRLKDIFVKNTVDGKIERISVSENGEQAKFNEAYNASDDSAISGDGRFVVFSSPASNLVEGDSNNLPDVFLKDRKTGSITLVSAGIDGQKADNFSQSPTVSNDGRFVTFDSLASNLTLEKTNGIFNVYFRDISSGKTVLASSGQNNEPGNGESQCPHMSSDGSIIVYSSLATNIAGARHKKLNIFAYDIKKNLNFTVSGIPQGIKIKDPYFGNPHVSGDGRFVGYYCTDGHPIENSNISFNIFLTDIKNGNILLIY